MVAALPQPIRFTIEDPDTRGLRGYFQIVYKTIVRFWILGYGGILLASQLRSEPTALLWWIALTPYMSLLVYRVVRSFDFEHSLASKNVPTVVTFAETGIEIARAAPGKRGTKRLVPFRKIRTVGTAKGDVVITVGETPFVLPASALPDGHVAIMNYFEDRIVGKRLLRKPGSRYRRTATS